MTKRDLFRVLIKVFALYSIILTVFSWIPSNMMYSFYGNETAIILAASLIFTFLLILIYVFLIKKTDAIIDFLKIDRGFDDNELKLLDFNSKKVLMLGIILIGGYLIISELSNFIQYAFLAFKNEISRGQLYVFPNGSANDENYIFELVFSGINLLIGYLLLTNYTKVSKWILKKGNKN
ncbi:hypothetical protein [Winogradskyella jejuensis]|uniref:Uncharacterized protein n=1 Tax=Winogradskyella jejuensis TaxID=1089305 RepID=A0A1M5MKR9_9FLAO|nr:hypothetical protein [Winogradskyella jejuensis]SHG77861.1 hypothetical protein SAMN05444148_0924 [Winogradskyella jejuensis]